MFHFILSLPFRISSRFVFYLETVTPATSQGELYFFNKMSHQTLSLNQIEDWLKAMADRHPIRQFDHNWPNSIMVRLRMVDYQKLNVSFETYCRPIKTFFARKRDTSTTCECKESTQHTSDTCIKQSILARWFPIWPTTINLVSKVYGTVWV